MTMAGSDVFNSWGLAMKLTTTHSQNNLYKILRLTEYIKTTMCMLLIIVFQDNFYFKINSGFLMTTLELVGQSARLYTGRCESYNHLSFLKGKGHGFLYYKPEPTCHHAVEKCHWRSFTSPISWTLLMQVESL